MRRAMHNCEALACWSSGTLGIVPSRDERRGRKRSEVYAICILAWRGWRWKASISGYKTVPWQNVSRRSARNLLILGGPPPLCGMSPGDVSAVALRHAAGDRVRRIASLPASSGASIMGATSDSARILGFEFVEYAAPDPAAFG